MTRIRVTQTGEPVAARQRSSRVEPASVPVDRLSWLWLAIAVALLPFSTVHAELPLAAWFAPIFVLRFARTQSIRVGAPFIVLVSSAALAFAWRHMFEFPIGLIIGSGYGLAFSLAYVADRALSPRLAGLLRSLVFPTQQPVPMPTLA